VCRGRRTRSQWSPSVPQSLSCSGRIGLHAGSPLEGSRKLPQTAGLRCSQGQRDGVLRSHPGRTERSWPCESPLPTLTFSAPSSSSNLHRDPLRPFAPASYHQPPAETLPEPGLYFLQRRRGPMIPLVKHTLSGGEASAQIAQTAPAGLNRRRPHRVGRAAFAERSRGRLTFR
jgi:hypothetical protein